MPEFPAMKNFLESVISLFIPETGNPLYLSIKQFHMKEISKFLRLVCRLLY